MKVLAVCYFITKTSQLCSLMTIWPMTTSYCALCSWAFSSLHLDHWSFELKMVITFTTHEFPSLWSLSVDQICVLSLLQASIRHIKTGCIKSILWPRPLTFDVLASNLFYQLHITGTFFVDFGLSWSFRFWDRNKHEMTDGHIDR